MRRFRYNEVNFNVTKIITINFQKVIIFNMLLSIFDDLPSYQVNFITSSIVKLFDFLINDL